MEIILWRKRIHNLKGAVIWKPVFLAPYLCDLSTAFGARGHFLLEALSPFNFWDWLFLSSAFVSLSVPHAPCLFPLPLKYHSLLGSSLAFSFPAQIHPLCNYHRCPHCEPTNLLLDLEPSLGVLNSFSFLHNLLLSQCVCTHTCPCMCAA